MNNILLNKKILIITPIFSVNEGMGITLKNLFASFPTQNIAIASFGKIVVDDSISFNNFYQISNNEIDYKFKISRKYKFLPNYKISYEFDNWIKNFNADLIFFVPFGNKITLFYNKIINRYNKTYATYIVDEYKKRNNKGILYFYLELKTNILYNRLVKKSFLCLSISSGMSEVFNKRFNKPFYPFHNPVDISHFKLIRKVHWDYEQPFKILQVGNISSFRYSALINFCEAISRIKNHTIILDIFAPNINNDSHIYQEISKYNFVNIKNSVSHHEMIELLPKYDLTTILMNFDIKSIQQVYLSYSTNTSELMASGTPIFIYAPPKIKFVEDAIRNHWAYVAAEENIDNLKNHIIYIIENKEKRIELAQNAWSFALENDDIVYVNNKLISLIENK